VLTVASYHCARLLLYPSLISLPVHPRLIPRGWTFGGRIARGETSINQSAC